MTNRNSNRKNNKNTRRRSSSPRQQRRKPQKLNRSRRLSTKKASDLRRRLKSLLGNKCFFCGYSICLRALEFHHIKKTEKSFNISESVLKYSWRRLLEELLKTVLVCSNHHCEIEDEIRFVRKKDIPREYYKLVREALKRSRHPKKTKQQVQRQ